MPLQELKQLELRVELERVIDAPIADVFDAVLDELGPHATSPDGHPMSMKIEPFPGGRWWRDLGGGNGHLWAHVQAIKAPTLIELTGPLFMSHAVSNNVQYRLAEEGGKTVLRFVHEAFGMIPEVARANVGRGWNHKLDRIQENARGES